MAVGLGQAKAFTLIALLVVIAIIAILAVMLPAEDGDGVTVTGCRHPA